MNASVAVVPLWLELGCVGVGAFQGALYAIVSHRFDLVGVSIVALVTGLGGGTVRDLLLANGRPVTLQDRYLATVGVAIIAAVALGRWHQQGRKPVLVLDSIALGLFAVAGTYKALMLGTSSLVAVTLGLVTAVGGGILRDLVCRVTPAVFKGGPLYATAAVVGSITFLLLLQQTALSLNASVIIAAAITLLLRVLSLRFGWYLSPAVRSLDE